MNKANRLGLGTANFGLPYGIIKNENLPVFSILDAARECGITTIDTARAYGSSEEQISKYLKGTQDFFPLVISKFSLFSFESDIQQSTMFLGKNLKVLLLHNYSKRQRAEVQQVLENNQNNVQFGCSTYGIENALDALDVAEFNYIEIEYSMLNPHVYKSIKTKATERGKKLLLRSIFHKGFLTTQGLTTNLQLHKDSKKDAILKKQGKDLLKTFKEANLTPEEAALKFAFATTKTETVLFGANTPEEVRRNSIMQTQPPLPESTLAELNQISNAFDPETLDLRDWVS